MRSFGLALIFILTSLMTAEAGAIRADSTAPQIISEEQQALGAPADSVPPAEADTLASASTERRQLLSDVLMPLALTAAAGGLLLLLFTQRGR